MSPHAWHAVRVDALDDVPCHQDDLAQPSVRSKNGAPCILVRILVGGVYAVQHATRLRWLDRALGLCSATRTHVTDLLFRHDSRTVVCLHMHRGVRALHHDGHDTASTVRLVPDVATPLGDDQCAGRQAFLSTGTDGETFMDAIGVHSCVYGRNAVCIHSKQSAF